jgi:hypothetical protein
MTRNTEGRRKKWKILTNSLYKEQIHNINEEYFIIFNMKKRFLSLKFIFCEEITKLENENKKLRYTILVTIC